MVNIQAIEKSVMTTTDEKLLKQMAESMPFDIYQQLSPEARGRLAKAYGKEVPASSPYTGVLPMKKAHRKLTEKERDRMIDAIASGPLTYRPAIDDELFKLGLIEWYDRDPKTNAVDYSGKPFYANNGRILPEWYEFKTQTKVQKTEFERMMDEVATVIVKYGYRNLGYQQTLSGEDLLRFIKGRDLIDVVAEFGIDEERYESVMQFEKQG